MARPKKDAPVELRDEHKLSEGLIDRLTCPAGQRVAFLRSKDVAGLRVRVTAKGVKSFVYEAKFNGKFISRTLGRCCSLGLNDGMGIREAIDAATELARTVKTNKQDPREVERQQQAEQATAKAAELEAEKYTLKNLLEAYCDYLKELERKSHADARSIFKNHIFEQWPDVAALPANRVTDEQIADMMRRVIEAGKDRTANKLRSYVRAAYQVAKASRSKASIPVAFKSYNVRTNPAADTEPDESANRSDKNPLSTDELRSYWKKIKTMPGFIGAALRLHLLTGGQRIEQLVCLLTANVGKDSIMLFDGKGRPGKGPRRHTVPLIPLAATALAVLKPSGAYAISTECGKTHLSASTLSDWASAAAAAVGIEGFQTKRIRSGVETLLASARITTDHRGRLQSHGITGVQARHYDGHDYLDEKRHALETLYKLLNGKLAKPGKSSKTGKTSKAAASKVA